MEVRRQRRQLRRELRHRPLRVLQPAAGDDADDDPAGEGAGLAGKTVVCIITGSGLKDPERAMAEFAPELRPMPPDLPSVEREMGLT